LACWLMRRDEFLARQLFGVRDLAAQPWPPPPCLRSGRLLLRTGAANFCWRPGTSVLGRFGQLLIDTRALVPLTHNATTGAHPPRLPGDVHRDPKDRYPLRRRWRVIHASCPGASHPGHQRDAKTADRYVSNAARLLIRLLTNSQAVVTVMIGSVTIAALPAGLPLATAGDRSSKLTDRWANPKVKSNGIEEIAKERFDVLIVGAGSSGCVLAARLSEDPHRKVLLVEAGPYYPELADYPEELVKVSTMAATFPGHPNSWSFTGHLTDRHPHPIQRGKVVGGSSAVNGTVFLRARPEDFAIWARLGNDQWNFNAVLPYFVKSEHDRDFSTAYHGQSGPLPIRRLTPEQLHPISIAFAHACQELGYPEEPDKNSPDPEGVGPIPCNCINGIRMNAAITYLAMAKGRDNLTIAADTIGREVLFHGDRAIGIEADSPAGRVRLYGDEIVLCAGAIKSPHLLMLSGIGPANALRKQQIRVKVDSPGVGINVADHPTLRVRYRIADKYAVPLAPSAVPLQMSLNYMDTAGGENGDLQIIPVASSLFRMLRPSFSRPIATAKALSRLSGKFLFDQLRSSVGYQLLCALEREASRGVIELRSADPADSPVIRLNYLSQPEDMLHIRTNMRMAAELLSTKAFRDLGAMRASPGDDDLRSERALDAWIVAHLGTAFHTSCSAKMGPDSDALAVVDQYCRVRGVTNLRVVDLSIAPTMIGRAPHATAIMIGERAADFFAS
jgi:choline dehydrogenase